MRVTRIENIEELKIVRHLAERIWNDHYVEIIGQDQVDYMLGRMYDLESLRHQMAGGDEAIKKMAEIDAGRGFADPEKEMGPELGEGYRQRPPAVNPTQGGNQASTRAGAVTGADVLSDADLANMNVEQAKQLESQAKTLMAEAKRLKAEATSLKPKAKKAKNVGKSKKTKATA